MNDLQELIKVFSETKDLLEMEQLFEELFTTNEKNDFALRWRLMKDLYKGVPQREIAQELGISLCKITRGSKILKHENSICRIKIEEIEHDNG